MKKIKKYKRSEILTVIEDIMWGHDIIHPENYAEEILTKLEHIGFEYVDDDYDKGYEIESKKR